MACDHEGRPSVTALIHQVHLSAGATFGPVSMSRPPGTPLVPAINLSCANEFADIGALGLAHGDKYVSVRYGRDSSDLVIQAERHLSALHESSSVCLFQSGMAAIDAALTAGLRNADVIAVIGSTYRKSSDLIKLKAEERRIQSVYLDSIDSFLDFRSAFHGRVLVFVESPSNPFLEIRDIRKLRSLAPDCLLIADITLQGLANDRLGLHGFADIVVSSCTKYAGGHNDILAGYAVTASECLFRDLWEFRSMRGCILDALSAYLLIRSLRTYDVRIEKQVFNAKAVLKFLRQNGKVDRIYYPGSCANKGQGRLFRASQYHGGSVLTFGVHPSIDIRKNIGSLLSAKMAPGFGSVDTLIEIPAFMSHWGKTPEELAAAGLDDALVRLSVGLEPLELILADLDLLLHG